MKKKKIEVDPFEAYHKSALRQELFGMAFGVAAIAFVVLGFIWTLQHFPYKH